MQQTRDTVTVTVNAPGYVEETFIVTIDVDNVTDLNSAQFDISFNSSVVNVTEVRGGEIEGKAVPIYMWDFKDSDRVRVISKLPGVKGASGSGYLAEIEFEVKGKSGEKSTLDISEGRLSNVSAKQIIADWYDAEVTVLRTVVWVDAPGYVNETFNAMIKIDTVTDLNSAQFNLSFNSSVVNVTEVRGGVIDSKAVPLYTWNFTDSDTISVISNLSAAKGASGSGYLAAVEFEVKGKSGERSKLNISNGKLVNVSAKEINAGWYDTEVTVLWPAVSVDAPESVSDTFNATIRIVNVTDLNSAQFNLSFNSSVVNVTEVRGGVIDSKAVPLYMWNFTDSDMITVISNLSGAEGASGAGYLAEIEFAVKGKSGDKSTLNISNGKLVNTKANEINADWYDVEVTIELPNMTVTVTPGTILVSVPTLVTLNVTAETTGAPINGATVTLSAGPWSESNTTTNGECTFTVTSPFPGTINVAVTAPGYNDGSAELIATTELLNMTVTVTPGTILVSVPTLVTLNVTAETTGAPINGATVTLSAGPWSESNTTSDGECTFTVTSPFPGTINVAVAAPGYNDGSAKLIAATELPNMTVTVTPDTILKLVPTIVTINVTAKTTGAPINGATVTLSAGPWSESNTTTNGECTFTVTSPFPGTINVAVVASGYNDGSADLIVATGPSLTWEIKPPTSVKQGDNVTFDVRFSESASYVISIKNSSGVVVKSWSGTEKDPEPMIWTTTTSDAPGDYTIKTGSYPQIIHEHEFSATGGTITCTVFVDANGREYADRIPAIKLW